jgi:hypothetical protein
MDIPISKTAQKRIIQLLPNIRLTWEIARQNNLKAKEKCKTPDKKADIPYSKDGDTVLL